MEIRRYIALLLHWTWLIILVTIITGSAAYVINKQTPPIYAASARLIVDLAPGEDYRDLLIEERLSQTYIELIKTRPIQEEASRRLGGHPITGLSVNDIDGTQMIRISVENQDPVQAALIANTVAQVFIDLNQERQRERYAESIANWDQRLATLDTQIKDLETQINSFGDTSEPEVLTNLSRLERQLNEAKFSYTEAFEQREGLTVQQAKEINSVSIIEDAIPASTPIRPRVVTNTLLATVVGALTAVGLVFLIDYLDDTIKTPDQIEDLTGLSTLGAIAYIRGDDQPDRLVAFNTPRAPISEAFRVLRTNISFSAVDRGLKSVLVTSSSPAEGKSTTAANLGVAIAQTGQRVILVDADLRRPSQHKIFEVSNNQGLTTALLDTETPIAYHVQETRLTGLRVLTSGPLPPNPAELLNSQRMSDIIAALQQESDTLVFDTPPTLTVADAPILAPQVTGCLMVVQLGKTRRDALQEAQNRLLNSGALLFGVVLNQLRPGRSGYYDYYYYYRYYAYDHRDRRASRVRGLRRWLARAGR